MGMVEVKCSCGALRILRQAGKYYWVCRKCGLSNPISTTIVREGVSLKKMREAEETKKSGILQGVTQKPFQKMLEITSEPEKTSKIIPDKEKRLIITGGEENEAQK